MEIIIQNNSNNKQRVTLFGFNKNLLLLRFGNPQGIEIETEEKGGYLKLLALSGNRPFVVKSFKLETYNSGYSRKDIITMTASKIDANGYCSQFPIKLQNRIRLEQQAVIDGNTELFLDIEANTKFLLDIDVNGLESEAEKQMKLRKKQMQRRKRLLIIR